MAVTEDDGAADRAVPTPPPLSASDRSSFAYPTLKDRVPIIICKVIDRLYRSRRNAVGGNGTADDIAARSEGVKIIVDKMAQLRYELQTNKPLTPLEDPAVPSREAWNRFLEEETERNGGEPPKWFETKWLYAECYAYRRLAEAMAAARTVSKQLADEDFFALQKRESYRDSADMVRAVVVTLDASLAGKARDRETFILLLKVCLWGNRFDLSISSGTSHSFEGDPGGSVHALDSRILADQSADVWDALSSEPAGTVDVVMDNAGFELVSDFCLAEYLVATGMAKKVRFRLKDQPWFVSDTMEHDVWWVLDQMEEGSSEAHVVDAAKRWRAYLSPGGPWSLHSDPFWTYPHEYSLMKSCDPSLYRELSESAMVLFKGDLNYRKLVGDFAWPPTIPFRAALQEFRPSTAVVTLRTLKADVVAGLAEGVAESTRARDKEWMINGEWAVIQMSRN